MADRGFSIPLPFSQARGASPSLTLSYSSGAGNGIFGLGWNLSLVASIKRKTDKGLPQYLDAIDSDVFLFRRQRNRCREFQKESDGAFTKDAAGDYVFTTRDSADGLFTIRNYRPRIEGLFAKIEQWVEKADGRMKWRVITKDNTTTLFGWTDNSILSQLGEPLKIYEWLPEFVFDDKGNCSQYIYKKENKSGLEESLIHNRNRMKNGNITYTNLYLDKVLYGNKTPYKQFGDAPPNEVDYLFKTVFDYGTMDYKTQPIEQLNQWDFRSDSFSDYKAGFEIRTTRLCKRVMLYHHFTGANEYDGLVRSVNFEYDTSSEQQITFLKAFTLYGYIKKPNGTYSYKKLPSMEFGYQKHDWNSEIKTVSASSLVHAPVGIEHAPYQLSIYLMKVLPVFFPNRQVGGITNTTLEFGVAMAKLLMFEEAKLVSPKPSFSGLGDQLQLMDLDADGGKQLVSYHSEPRGFFELDDDKEWQGMRSFRGALPNIDFGDPNTRMLDLNGHGKAEVVISEYHVFTWYASDGRNGFSAATKAGKPFDEEEVAHRFCGCKADNLFSRYVWRWHDRYFAYPQWRSLLLAQFGLWSIRSQSSHGRCPIVRPSGCVQSCLYKTGRH